MNRAAAVEAGAVLLWLVAISVRIGLTKHRLGGLAYVKPGKWRTMWVCHYIEMIAITGFWGVLARFCLVELPSKPAWSRWAVAIACIIAVTPSLYGGLLLGRMIGVRIKGWPARAVVPLLPMSHAR